MLRKVDLDAFGIGLAARPVPLDEGALDALACGSVPLDREDEPARSQPDDVAGHGSLAL
jgi:hypothetical protein